MKTETLKTQHKPKRGERVTDVGKKRSSGPGVGIVCELRSLWKRVNMCLCVCGWLRAWTQPQKGAERAGPGRAWEKGPGVGEAEGGLSVRRHSGLTDTRVREAATLPCCPPATQPADTHRVYSSGRPGAGWPLPPRQAFTAISHQHSRSLSHGPTPRTIPGTLRDPEPLLSMLRAQGGARRLWAPSCARPSCAAEPIKPPQNTEPPPDTQQPRAFPFSTAAAFRVRCEGWGAAGRGC